MSYILDALRKSEAERATAQAPTPTTVHEGDRAPPRRRWLWGLVSVNLAVVGLVLWALVGQPPARQPIAAPSSSEPVRRTPPATIEQTEPAPMPTAPPAPAPAPPIDEHDLAEPLRSRIARLTFSTHIYADDPAMRAVSIDGQRLREGQSSDAGYRVDRITPNGVVLDVDGQRVAIDVMARWRI